MWQPLQLTFDCLKTKQKTNIQTTKPIPHFFFFFLSELALYKMVSGDKKGYKNNFPLHIQLFIGKWLKEKMPTVTKSDNEYVHSYLILIFITMWFIFLISKAMGSWIDKP